MLEQESNARSGFGYFALDHLRSLPYHEQPQHKSWADRVARGSCVHRMFSKMRCKTPSLSGPGMDDAVSLHISWVVVVVVVVVVAVSATRGRGGSSSRSSSSSSSSRSGSSSSSSSRCRCRSSSSSSTRNKNNNAGRGGWESDQEEA